MREILIKRLEALIGRVDVHERYQVQSLLAEVQQNDLDDEALDRIARQTNACEHWANNRS